MVTKKLTPYEKAVRRAGRAYAALATETDEARLSPLAERALVHLTVVQHWSDPLEDCTCEGCSAWWPEAPSAPWRRARK